MTPSATRPLGCALFIEPPSHHFSRDRLFEPDAAPFGGDQLMRPYTHLREVLRARGVEVHTADALPVSPGGPVAYVSIGNLSRYEALASRGGIMLSAFFAMECPVIDPRLYRALARVQRHFRRIYSWSTSAALRPYVGADLSLHRFFWPQSFESVHESLWARADRKFLVMMQGNKMPALDRGSLFLERLRALEHFSQANEVDLYGREWDQPPYRVGHPRIPATFLRFERHLRHWWGSLRPDPLMTAARRAWRGPARSKAQTLSGYTFAICFENMALEGWITEKIFDCFFTGTIPLYLGAPDIQDLVPVDCFVDVRRFPTYADLADYVRSLGTEHKKRYREAAREYLGSPAFARFSKQAFAEMFVTMLEHDFSTT